MHKKKNVVNEREMRKEEKRKKRIVRKSGINSKGGKMRKQIETQTSKRGEKQGRKRNTDKRRIKEK